MKGDNKLIFYSVQEDNVGKLIVKYSLTLTDNLKFTMWCNGIKVPMSKVAHICKNKVAITCSIVLNIVVFLKIMSEEKLSPTDAIKYCTSLLEQLIPDFEDKKARKIFFLKRQLGLSMVSNFCEKHAFRRRRIS